MKKIIFTFIMLLMFLPQVFAGGSSDDVTYSADFDSNYVYGDVDGCRTVTGIGTYRGEKRVGGAYVCVYLGSTKDSVGVTSCKNETMSAFYISKITGSDGNEYSGWGCRKSKDGSEEINKISMYVGEGRNMPGYGVTCTITEGNEFGEFDKLNHCYFRALKPGTVKLYTEVESSKDDINTKVFYEISIIPRNSKISDLDENYTYGNVKSCPPSLSKKQFDGLTFCGTSLFNTDLNEESLTICADPSYTAFHLFFEAEDANQHAANGGHYEGYGCRKPKSEEVINYEKISLYANEGRQIASQYLYDCSIISGPGELNRLNSCFFSSSETGTTRIKATYKNSSTVKYYEVTINPSSGSISQLDDKYTYGNVSTCKIDNGDIVKFDDKDFCGSRLPGFTYDYAYTQVACEEESFDAFKLSFISNNVFYKGYACRKIKDPNNIVYIKKTLQITQREIVQSNSKCYLLSGEIDLNKDNCDLYANKNGTVNIRAVSKNTGEANYYQYEIVGDASKTAKVRKGDFYSPLTGDLTCEGLLGGVNSELRKLLTNILKFIRYGGPILMLLLTIVDLVKTVTSGDEKDFKKVFQNFIKRFIAAALLFFINDIIRLIFLIVGLDYECVIDIK